MCRTQGSIIRDARSNKLIRAFQEPHGWPHSLTMKLPDQVCVLVSKSCITRIGCPAHATAPMTAGPGLLLLWLHDPGAIHRLCTAWLPRSSSIMQYTTTVNQLECQHVHALQLKRHRCKSGSDSCRWVLLMSLTSQAYASARQASTTQAHTAKLPTDIPTCTLGTHKIAMLLSCSVTDHFSNT